MKARESKGQEPIDEGWFREFSGEWGETIFRSWEKLPRDAKEKLTSVLDSLPGNTQQWRMLIGEAVDHLRITTGKKRRVAIVGPVNVGKSTFYNQLVRSKMQRAEVSAVPGTTRQAQQGDAGLFVVVDTPGADATGAVGEQEKERALNVARQADVLIILFDASHGVRGPEKKMMGELMALQKPSVVALNKIDLVWRERRAVAEKMASELGMSNEQVIAISAKNGTGVDHLLLAVAKTEPEIVAALGAALPGFRWQLAGVVIRRAAASAAAIAATPLPFLDFIPLIAIQGAMVLSIARIYNYRITLARAKELIASFGAGVLGRTLFHELSKFGGPPGWVVAMGVAAGTTVGMGYASALWFEKGEEPSKEALKRVSETVSRDLVQRFGILKRRPRRRSLREQVREALVEEHLDEGSWGENSGK